MLAFIKRLNITELLQLQIPLTTSLMPTLQLFPPAMDPTHAAPPSKSTALYSLQEHNLILRQGKRPSPRVQRILKFIKLRKAGVPVAEVPWQAYQLQNIEFDELQRWLKQDEGLWGYVEDKVR